MISTLKSVKILSVMAMIFFPATPDVYVWKKYRSKDPIVYYV